jgi:hypothetical protein
VSRLLKFFIELCLLRAAPQDLPAAAVLMALCAGGYLTVGVLVSMTSFDPAGAVMSNLLDLFALAMLVRIGLAVRGKPQRFVQTYTALTGSGVILGLLGWPLAYGLFGSETAPKPLLALLFLGLILWNLAVIGHILRHALSVAFAWGVLIAVGYYLLLVQLNALLFAAGA